MNKEEILNTFLLANIIEIITQEEFDYVKKAIKELQKENKQLKDNWNMLKEHLTNRYNNGTESISYRQVFIEIREAMQVLEIQQELEQRTQELEKGDSNENGRL